jgi:hypothetical protein
LRRKRNPLLYVENGELEKNSYLSIMQAYKVHWTMLKEFRGHEGTDFRISDASLAKVEKLLNRRYNLELQVSEPIDNDLLIDMSGESESSASPIASPAQTVSDIEPARFDPDETGTRTPTESYMDVHPRTYGTVDIERQSDFGQEVYPQRGSYRFRFALLLLAFKRVLFVSGLGCALYFALRPWRFFSFAL